MLIINFYNFTTHKYFVCVCISGLDRYSAMGWSTPLRCHRQAGAPLQIGHLCLLFLLNMPRATVSFFLRLRNQKGNLQGCLNSKCRYTSSFFFFFNTLHHCQLLFVPTLITRTFKFIRTKYNLFNGLREGIYGR